MLRLGLLGLLHLLPLHLILTWLFIVVLTLWHWGRRRRRRHFHGPAPLLILRHLRPAGRRYVSFLRLDLLIFARLLINEAELVLGVWVVRITHCRRIEHVIPSAIIRVLVKLLLLSEVFLLHLNLLRLLIHLIISDLLLRLHWRLVSIISITI